MTLKHSELPKLLQQSWVKPIYPVLGLALMLVTPILAMIAAVLDALPRAIDVSKVRLRQAFLLATYQVDKNT